MAISHSLSAAALVTGALALTACGGSSAPQRTATQAASPPASQASPPAAAASAQTVTIKGFIFTPHSITVAAGTTVHWTNTDQIHHSVTAGTRAQPTPKRFDKLLDNAGSETTITFAKPGRYAYFCSFHQGEGMTGEVIVN